MGWGNCGTDSEGRPIGYVFKAICDQPGCDANIDRGLSYSCGGMHGEDEISCERYFCSEHLGNFVEVDGRATAICDECATLLLNTGHIEDEEEGVIVPAGMG